MMANPFKMLGEWWREYLKRMVRANQEEFGGRPPSCCSPRRRQEPDSERKRADEESP